MLVRRPRILTLCMTSALCLSGASSEGARQLGRAVAIGAIRALLRQIHNRGKHTINPELLISGLRAGMSVILGESWRCFFCAPYADTQGQERAAGTYRPQGIQSVPDVEDDGALWLRAASSWGTRTGPAGSAVPSDLSRTAFQRLRLIYPGPSFPNR